MSNIDCVIVHTGYKEYLKINLLITGKTNHVYLIGDASCQHLDSLPNVTFININKYLNKNNHLKEKFVNYSSNSSQFEWLCFERVFIIHQFLLEYNLSRCFHIDSDNILLRNINEYKFNKEIAYCKCKNYHNERMSNSIHAGLLNVHFCEQFTQLYTDIYCNKTKIDLIKNKINYHTNENGTYYRGGICDMTLYYLLADIIDVQNLLLPNDNYVFINNINNGEGWELKNQYKLLHNKLEIDVTSNTIIDITSNHRYNIFNIHFQGNAKTLMNENLIKQLE